MSVPETVAVAAMLVTPLAVVDSALVGTTAADVDGGGGSWVVDSGIVVLTGSVAFGVTGFTVGSNVASDVGGAVMSEMVVRGAVVSGVPVVTGGSVNVPLPLLGRVVGSTAVVEGPAGVVGSTTVIGVVGSTVIGVVGSTTVVVGSVEAKVVLGLLLSVPLVTGGGTSMLVGTLVGSSVAGGVVSAGVVGEGVGSVTGGVVSTTEPPVPTGRVRVKLIPPISVEVGSGAAVVGSGIAVGEGCSDSGVVGEAETGAVGSTVGKVVSVG